MLQLGKLVFTKVQLSDDSPLGVKNVTFIWNTMYEFFSFQDAITIYIVHLHTTYLLRYYKQHIIFQGLGIFCILMEILQYKYVLRSPVTLIEFTTQYRVAQKISIIQLDYICKTSSNVKNLATVDFTNFLWLKCHEMYLTNNYQAQLKVRLVGLGWVVSFLSWYGSGFESGLGFWPGSFLAWSCNSKTACRSSMVLTQSYR